MFWACWSNKNNVRDGWIGKAWMNGEKREKAVSSLIAPIGLTIDQDRGHLYWADSFTFKIERLNVKTNERKVCFDVL